MNLRWWLLHQATTSSCDCRAVFRRYPCNSSEFMTKYMFFFKYEAGCVVFAVTINDGHDVVKFFGFAALIHAYGLCLGQKRSFIFLRQQHSEFLRVNIQSKWFLHQPPEQRSLLTFFGMKIKSIITTIPSYSSLHYNTELIIFPHTLPPSPHSLATTR